MVGYRCAWIWPVSSDSLILHCSLIRLEYLTLRCSNVGHSCGPETHTDRLASASSSHSGSVTRLIWSSQIRWRESIWTISQRTSTESYVTTPFREPTGRRRRFLGPNTIRLSYGLFYLILLKDNSLHVIGLSGQKVKEINSRPDPKLIVKKYFINYSLAII